MITFSVQSTRREELIDITDRVSRAVETSEVTEGFCLVYTPHTTAAVTINENADPSVARDIITGLAGLGIEKIPFTHAEGNSPAHIKSSLVGCSETLIISGGRIVLGTWQGVYLCEFDGPRTRKVHIQIK